MADITITLNDQIEGNMAFTVTFDHRRSSQHRNHSFRHGLTKFVHYDNRQGQPDTQELHGGPTTADKSQTEKVGRRKNDEAPPPASTNQPMPR
jgi:hypothetical protein